MLLPYRFVTVICRLPEKKTPKSPWRSSIALPGTDVGARWSLWPFSLPLTAKVAWIDYLPNAGSSVKCLILAESGLRSD